jgi:hypothetical protein
VQEWVEKALKNKQMHTEATTPAQYQDYADVFSEKAVRRFPPL